MNQSNEGQPGARTRSIVSIALFIHLFLVFVALSANLRPWNSEVQSKVVDKFAPYLTTLLLDPEFRKFHLTHGLPLEDDHVIEVDLKASATGEIDQTVVLPGEGSGFLSQRHRLLVLAKQMAVMADSEQDAQSGLLAKAIGSHYLRRTGAQYAEVRVEQHESQPLYLDQLVEGYPLDPTDEAYRQSVYAANVFVADDDRIFVGKISSRRESAGAVPSRAKDGTGQR